MRSLARFRQLWAAIPTATAAATALLQAAASPFLQEMAAEVLNYKVGKGLRGPNHCKTRMEKLTDLKLMFWLMSWLMSLGRFLCLWIFFRQSVAGKSRCHEMGWKNCSIPPFVTLESHGSSEVSHRDFWMSSDHGTKVQWCPPQR